MIKRLFKLIIWAALLIAFAVYVVPAAVRVALPLKYEDLIQKYSDKYGVSKDVIAGVIMAESSFRSDAVSGAGAIGLMQVTPDTLFWLFSKTEEDERFDESQLKDPETNIKYGTLNLNLLAGAWSDEQTRYAAYNAGRARVAAWLSDPQYSDDGVTLKKIPFSETRRYVKKIVLFKKLYKYFYFN